jgi:hypothetical protein
MKKKLIYLTGIVLIVVACSSSDQKIEKTKYTDLWQIYMSNQIDTLTKANPRLIKTINQGDEVETLKMDSVNWGNELSGFLNIDFSKESTKNKYSLSTDSSGKISMIGFFAKDTNSYIQSFEVTRIDGKIDLLQWKTKTRSFLIDRDQVLAYQPGKGFRIQINENSLWASPKNIEIFGDIQNKAFLER